jgi:hypothetical protein
VFRPSPFAVPVGSFPIPVVPPTVDADAAPLVYVGLNCDWMPYITGALTQLLLQSTWEVDTPDELQLVQDRAWNLINLFNCQFLPTLAELCGQTGGDGECMGCCIRFQDGKFQTLDCGVWTDIPGQPDAGFGPVNGQPGQGAPQPIPGECREFSGTLRADGSYLIPVPLNEGDTVEISNVDGATNDNTITWWLQDGQIYFAGEAQGPVVFVPGDPVSGFPHASIIGSFDGGSTFFGVGTGLFTVPSGIVNQQMSLWVNFPMDLPRFGEYTFLVSVCNNATPTFVHTFPLEVATGGWVPDNDGGGDRAIWQPGVGYGNNPSYKPGRITIDHPNPGGSAAISRIQITLSGPLTGPAPQIAVGMGAFSDADTSGGAGADFTVPGTTINAIHIDVADDSANPSTPAVDVVITAVVITGTGPDPFI